MEPRYVSPKDAATYLGVSADTVLRLIRAGQLPAIRVAERLYRIPIPALERFVKGPVPSRPVVRQVADDVLVIGEGIPARTLDHR